MLISLYELLHFRVKVAFSTKTDDSDLGEVEDFWLSSDARQVQYMLVNGLFRPRRIIPQKLITEIQIESRRIFVSSNIELATPHEGKAFSTLRHSSVHPGFGRIRDVLCDRASLKTLFIAIKWWPNPTVIIPWDSLKVDLGEVQVNLSRDAIKNAPQYKNYQVIKSKAA